MRTSGPSCSSPWHDIEPGAELPGHGPVDQLLAGLDRGGVHRVPGAVLRSRRPARRRPPHEAAIMRPTRTSTLAIVAVLCAVVAWLLLRSVYEHLPPLPWTGVPALLVAAAAEAWTGRDLQARIAGRRGLKPAAPLFVSRMVALAKASSLAAAVIAGLAAGFVIYLSGSLSATVPRQDALTAAVTLARSPSCWPAPRSTWNTAAGCRTP